MCHPNADSYRDLSPKQIYRIHEKDNKRKHNSRVTEIEQGTFTALVFTTTGGITDECLRYHSRLGELLSAKKARKLCHNNFMGQGESVICNFAERAPMPKGKENPEKEELFGRAELPEVMSLISWLSNSAGQIIIHHFIHVAFIFIVNFLFTSYHLQGGM